MEIADKKHRTDKVRQVEKNVDLPKTSICQKRRADNIGRLECTMKGKY
jgi:hypothetical protein